MNLAGLDSFRLSGRLYEAAKRPDEWNQTSDRKDEQQEDADAESMVRHLLSANEKTLSDLRSARDLAGKHGDAESEDLMIGRLQVHEKPVWMLKSFIGE